jgi:molybdopterin-binding protein
MSALLNVRAAADRLGVSYSTLKQWIYDGAVRTVRTKGGHHRLAEVEVQRLLLAGTASDAAPSGKTAARGKVATKGSRATRLAPPAKSGVLVALSGRNQLRGIVEEVRGDGLLAQVRLRIGDQRLTAVITQDAVAELKLKRGDEAVAIIKSTEVMIGRYR